MKKELGWVRQEPTRTQKTEDEEAVEERLTAIENKLPNLVDVPTPCWTAKDHFADLGLPDL